MRTKKHGRIYKIFVEKYFSECLTSPCIPIEKLDVKKDFKTEIIFDVKKEVIEDIKNDVKNWDSF